MRYLRPYGVINEKYDYKINFVDRGNRYNDIRYTFLKLVQKAIPHGQESYYESFLPGLNRDKIGNFYVKIGDSDVMFTSHLDTASDDMFDIEQFAYESAGDEIIHTGKKSILGADDRSGVALMLKMLHNRIPGLYYFFIGEERGSIGSKFVRENFHNIEHMTSLNKCISFDRSGIDSIITHQAGDTCCSDQFSSAILNEFNLSGMRMKKDPTGVWTDSATFMDVIPECTNISVGYYNEHSENEYQNMTFLNKLSDSVLRIDWNSLPSLRNKW